VSTIEVLLLDGGTLEVGVVLETVVLVTAVLATELVAADVLATGELSVVEAVPLDRVADEAQPAQSRVQPITNQIVLFFMAVRPTAGGFR
jgi:hypothetical protein